MGGIIDIKLSGRILPSQQERHLLLEEQVPLGGLSVTIELEESLLYQGFTDSQQGVF